jgi:hypothetical protein
MFIGLSVIIETEDAGTYNHLWYCLRLLLGDLVVEDER